MKQSLLVLTIFLLTQNSVASDAVYFMSASDLMEACKPIISAEVAKVAGPQMHSQITDFKAGAKSGEYHSCCGIENWSLFDLTAYSSEHVYFSENGPYEGNDVFEKGIWFRTPDTVSVYSHGGIIAEPKEFKVVNWVTAKVPGEHNGFQYYVTTQFKAYPSSLGEWIVPLNDANPSLKNCISNLEFGAYVSDRRTQITK